MDKIYNHASVEKKIYQMWEKNGYFAPSGETEKTYSLILPPPNANGALHFGHAMFVIEDVLIRYHRMIGDKTLWLPGTDHAGLETQYVFEKKLAEKGKSRFDFSREELYDMIAAYVAENRGGIEEQLRSLGFSLDWSREKFTLDPNIIAIVNKTFRRMYEEKLVYRAYRLVNYCTKDGTSLSDIEVIHEERKSPLYYIKYGPLVLATTRPETKFGDTAVAVHPDDKRYKKYIGQEIEIETVLGTAKIRVIADTFVDPTFGTGVVKITPAHDFNDFETGKRHNLPLKQVIGFDGKMNEAAGKFAGLYVKKAREAIVSEMSEKGLIEKIDENYINRVGICYKCKMILEPLPLEQWYINVKPLVEPAIKAVKEDEISIFPQNFKTIYFQWLENLRDWNISRQSIWGIRIPVWYEIEREEDFTITFLDKENNSHQGVFSEMLRKGYSWEDMTRGLQRVIASTKAKVVFEEEKQSGEKTGKRYFPETDTFDTWFSSSQWPFATLMTTFPNDFKEFYPTTVMETGYDILKAWVSRMIMMGLYVTGKTPFKTVILHGLVNDPYGKKMSKSKGNVVNPIELINQYGADAVRFALVYGTALGNDQSLSYPKLQAMRNFTNKLWNIARFIEMQKQNHPEINFSHQPLNDLEEELKEKKSPYRQWITETDVLMQEVTDNIEQYNFNLAAEKLYEFIWHTFADIYIEQSKGELNGEIAENREEMFAILCMIFTTLLKLLHPFMPFVTEEIYNRLGNKGSIMIEKWPVPVGMK